MELIAFILGFAVLNRFCGGGFERPQGPLPHLPGRPVWYADLALLVALPLIYGQIAAALGELQDAD